MSRPKTTAAAWFWVIVFGNPTADDLARALLPVTLVDAELLDRDAFTSTLSHGSLACRQTSYPCAL
jgi:hypothetical protein